MLGRCATVSGDEYCKVTNTVEQITSDHSGSQERGQRSLTVPALVGSDESEVF